MAIKKMKENRKAYENDETEKLLRESFISIC
jgi:hypothetical protein